MATKLILDTDIGDDIDDALALGLALAAKEIELVGVTTVFKNTAARTRQARTILQVAGRAGIPVAAGCGAVLSPRRDYDGDPRQAYLEGELPNQDASCLPEAELAPADARHAVDFIIDTVLAGAGDIAIATIGAMTNLAMALVKEPRIIARIPRVVAMAAVFERPLSEWNIKCDPVAAALVFASGIPMRIIGLDVTMQVQFRRQDLDRLATCERGLARQMWNSIAVWQRDSGWAQHIQGLPIMHDPLAIATLVRPEVVRWRRGTASVELQGAQSYGFTLFREDAGGVHEYACAVDADAALDLWMDRVIQY